MLNSIDMDKEYSVAKRWFLLFCVVHFILWVLAPGLIYQNPPTDAVEGVAWGNLWLWGYEKHPFLAPWITAFTTNLLGSISWAIYILSQCAVLVCFYSIWQLAKQFFSPWYSLLAVVLLEGINYYNLQSVIFDPNVLVLPLWALMGLVFYSALQKQKIKHWVWLGILAGLAMDSKYESILLFVVFLMLLIITPEGRTSFKKPGIYLSLLLGLLIFAPNFIWLWQHNFNAVSYAVDELNETKLNHIPIIIRPFYESVKFLLEQIGNLLPMFLLYLPFYKGQDNTTKLTLFQRRYLIFLGLGPLALTLLIAVLMQAHLVSRWGFPFFSWFPMFWLAYRKPIITQKRLKIFAILVSCLMILMLLGQITYYLVMPYITKKANHAETFPGKNVALALTRIWHDHYHTKMPYIAGTHHVVVNVSAFSPDKPVPYFDWALNESPWVNETEMRQKGAIFVYLVGDVSELKQIKERFPNIKDEQIIQFKSLTHAPVKPISIWIGILPPSN
ncbi:MAG: glycosyltransferase family 39 protein [Gammaproteobacteria bacterium]